MQRSSHLIISIFIILALLVSCTKVENKPFDPASMWDCYYEKEWDSKLIEKTLIGEWDWQYISCYWDFEGGNDDEYEGLSIEFKSNNTLSIIEDGQVMQTANWKIVSSDVDLFEIEADPYISQIYGIILFCEDRVVFNNSIVDGCDNLFQKKK